MVKNAVYVEVTILDDGAWEARAKTTDSEVQSMIFNGRMGESDPVVAAMTAMRAVFEKVLPQRKTNVLAIAHEVASEVFRATTIHKSMNSLHEGYAVLLEEVEELWDEIKKRSSERDLRKLREEAIQVAAMGMRIVYDVIDQKKA